MAQAPRQAYAARRWRRPSPPALALLATLAGVCVLIGFHPNWNIDTNQWGNFWNHLARAENLSPEHGYASFHARVQTDAGIRYLPYHRFPPLGDLFIKLATLPFPDDSAARIRAARTLMLAFFAAAAVIAWLAVRQLVEDEWIALAATALAFSSFHALFYADIVHTYGIVDLFAVMLAFHGVAVFATSGRLAQLLAKVCVALLFGWHVYALVGPLALAGVGAAAWRRDWRAARRHAALGAVAVLFGAAVLAVNIARERALLDDDGPVAELPSFRSVLRRSGLTPARQIDWSSFPAQQLHRLALASTPYAAGRFAVDNPAFPGRVHRGVPGYAAAAATLLLTTLALVVLARRRQHAGAAAGGPASGRRAPLVALALAGVCWSLALRHNTHDPIHDFEGIFHIGLPLAFFALALPALVPRPALAKALGLGAIGVLGTSAAVSARALQNPHSAATAGALAADLDAALAVAGDATVLTPPSLPWMVSRYLLRGVVQLPFREADLWHLTDVVVDKRLAPGGVQTPTLTPGNRLLFLYSRADFEAALGRYVALAGARAPDAASAAYDIHHLPNRGFGGDLLYVRRDCPTLLRRETEPRFFLHVHPVDAKALPKHRAPAAFDNLNFSAMWFWQAGGSCYAVRRLPDYPIASIHTGQFTRRAAPGRAVAYQNVWELRFSIAIDTPQETQRHRQRPPRPGNPPAR